MNIEQIQEQIKNWMMGPENIYQSTILSYPSLHSQGFILNFTILNQLCREFHNPQDLQRQIANRFLNPEDFHEGAIYLCFLMPLQTKMLYEIIKNNGLHETLLFYKVFCRFLNNQIHLLKEPYRQHQFQIMEILLDNPIEQFDECFKCFIRTVNIYNQNLSLFINFSFTTFEKIYRNPIYSCMLFYKYLLILNIDQLYSYQNFPIQIIAKYMQSIWQMHIDILLQFGRELFINLQNILCRQEVAASLPLIKQQLSKFAPILQRNEQLSKQFYKLSYQIGLPIEVENRLIFAIFQQVIFDSIKIQLQMLFEKYGYHIQFIGQMIRYLICLIDYEPEQDASQYRIGETLVLIYQICEFSQDNWFMYLKFIFADYFYYNSEQKDDHNLLAGICFIKRLHHYRMYNEINQIFYFLFQTLESNETLKNNVNWVNLGRYNIFSRLLSDSSINESVKSKISRYFLVEKEEKLDQVEYISQESKYYVLEQTEEKESSMEVEYYLNPNLESAQLPTEDEDTEGCFMDVNFQFYQYLCRQKIESIFTQSQDKEYLIRFLTIYMKQVNQDLKMIFLQEGTKILSQLYEDQFYDINFEYQFNILIEIVNLYEPHNCIEELIESLLIKEPFSFTLLLLAYFENRFQSQFWLGIIQSRAEEVLSALQKLQQLLPHSRLDKILLKMLNLEWGIPIMIDLFNRISDQAFANVKVTLTLPLINELYGNWGYFSQERQSVIQEWIVQKALEAPTLKEYLNYRSQLMWQLLQIVVPILLKQGRVSEAQTIDFFKECFNYCKSDTNGVNELFYYIPNISKALILKGLNQYLEKNDGMEIYSLIPEQGSTPLQSQIKQILDIKMKN